jgi:hypothetical protein
MLTLYHGHRLPWLWERRRCVGSFWICWHEPTTPLKLQQTLWSCQVSPVPRSVLRRRRYISCSLNNLKTHGVKICWNSDVTVYRCVKVKVKQFHSCPGQTLRVPAVSIFQIWRPWRLQQFRAPRFEDNRHMKVIKLSDLGTGRMYPQDLFLVLISVRGHAVVFLVETLRYKMYLKFK